MEDKRYTTKDKIIMYKDVVALYDREKQIAGYDKATFKKRQLKTCRKLSKDLTYNKQELNVYRSGNRQEIKNCLQSDKRLLLAYQNLNIHEIIDHIQQDNFNLRKTFDRLMYKFKVKVKKLIYLKLDVAFYEDILAIMQSCTNIEIRSKIVAEQVQAVILKQDAAIQVGITYREIIECMKKDRVYFNGLLDALQNDLHQQNRSIFNTIELGQLSVERWDDIRKEYDVMKSLAKEEILYEKCIIKHETPKQKEIPPCECDISKDISKMNQLQDVFNELQEITKTTNFHAVFTCIQKQKEQSSALREVQKKLSVDKEALQNKVDQARYSLNYFLLMTEDENEEYMSEIDKLQEDISFKIRELLKVRKLLANKNELWAKLNMAFTQIEIKCSPVRVPPGSKLKVRWQIEPHHNAVQKFDTVYTKIKFLATNTQDISMDNLPLPSYRKNVELEETTQSRGRLLETISVDRDQVPTREDIKEASTNIVTKALTLEAKME